MNQVTFLLTLLIPLLSCTQSKENQIESVLFDCLIKSYNEHQIDIEQELNTLENYLIKNKSLKSSSGQSYYEFYSKITELNEIPATINHKEFENIFKLSPNEYYSNDCLNKLIQLDSLNIVDSKYFKLNLALQNAAQNKKSPANLAKAITSALDSSDFNKSYYKVKKNRDRHILLKPISNWNSLRSEHSIIR
jgi:hypothetical protein